MGKNLICSDDCNFCGQDKTIIGTPHGVYCKGCVWLMIEEFEETIRDLEEKEFGDSAS